MSTSTNSSNDKKGEATPPPIKKHPLQHFLAGACAGVVEVSSLVRSVIQFLARICVVVARPILPSVDHFTQSLLLVLTLSVSC
jgi:hypothetical protein